jgi:hypothetical protein
VGLEVDLPLTRGIHHVVGVFANERAEVVELTDVPPRMSEWADFGGAAGGASSGWS